MVNCRYGEGCVGPDCWFGHPPNLRRRNTPICKFGMRCRAMTCWRDHPQGDAWSSLKTGIENLRQENDVRWLKEIKELKNRCREIREAMRKETKEKRIEI